MCMSFEASKDSTGRAPRRSNGIKRREAILTAAAEIISESGIAGLTLHATARRANSSIGSMYHFFGDKEQLLEGLRDRHRKNMAQIMQHILEIGDEDWRRMTSTEVIEALFGRPIRYYSDNPFALELHQLHEGQAIDSFLLLVERVMKGRLDDTRGYQAARMLFAISSGTLAFTLDVRNMQRRALVAEIPAALTSYLASLEATIA